MIHTYGSLIEDLALIAEALRQEGVLRMAVRDGHRYKATLSFPDGWELVGVDESPAGCLVNLAAQIRRHDPG